VTADLHTLLSHFLSPYYTHCSHVSVVACLYVDISAGIRSECIHHIVLEAPGVPILSRSFALPLACLVLDSTLSLFHSAHRTSVHKLRGCRQRQWMGYRDEDGAYLEPEEDEIRLGAVARKDSIILTIHDGHGVHESELENDQGGSFRNASSSAPTVVMRPSLADVHQCSQTRR